MLMVIPDEGKLKWLYWALDTDGSDLEDFVLDLYQNNYTPDDASTASSFTVSSFGGYAQVSLLRSAFGAPAITSHVAYSGVSTPPAFSCTSGGSQTAYGWYLRGATSDKVLAAAAFDVPRVMSPGATETLDPFRLGLKTFT